MINLWTPPLKTLATALDNQLRLVGGCVRDNLLNRTAQDIDLTTPFLPRQVISLLSAARIKTYPIALGHGVVGVNLHHHTFEITTLRQDLYTPDFHESTRFITDYALDSDRRDFTINALSMDTDNTLFDYHHGADDLSNHIVRFIGDPQKRLHEDPHRLLRYLRFWALYGNDTPDDHILSLFSEIGPLLPTVSPFRRHKEFLKILALEKAPDILDLLKKYDLLPFICSGFAQKKLDLPPDFVAYLGKRKDM